MLEREMEDLIAANPENFFPRHGFVLQGRQQSFRGVGRFDLLFIDRHGMNILMELKAVPARYEVIDQVANYRDALTAQGATNIIMWIVAPSIPPGLRDFFSHLGIEYTEIHESEFNRAAVQFGYALRAPQLHSPNVPVSAELSVRKVGTDPGLAGTAPAQDSIGKGTDAWGFGIGTQPAFLIRSLEAGGKTKEQIRSEYIAHFHPELSYAEAKSKSGFGVFFSDCKRPVGTYHASRSLVILKDSAGHLSLDQERALTVKAAIAGGILKKLRGLNSKRDKNVFNDVLRSFGLPPEP